MTTIKIGNRKVGDDQPVLIMAELSANHNQQLSLAMKTIKAMKESGADVVKLQTYTPDTITLNSRAKHFRVDDGSVWSGKNLHDLYAKAYTPWEWQPKLKKYAEELGMLCFSSPFDPTAVDFLEKMKVPAYKVASYEITDIPLIEYMARRQKPMIISTGVAKLGDIKEAISACRRVGNNQIAILKCTSAYPAPFEEINLRTIPNIGEKFRVIPGISDHTMGSTVAIAACTLGAKIVEKHFILGRKMGGPDSTFSMEPAEFKVMVQSIRDIEKALGQVTYELTPEAKIARWNVRSLFVVQDIRQGDPLTPNNIRSIRPGNGLAPKYYDAILGRKAKTNLEKGTPLRLQDLVES